MSDDGKIDVTVTLRLAPEVVAWLRDRAAGHGNTPDAEASAIIRWEQSTSAAAETKCPRGHSAMLDHRIHARYAMGDTVPVTCRACEITYLRNLATGSWTRIPEVA